MNKKVRKGHAETTIIAVEMIDGSQPVPHSSEVGSAPKLEESGGSTPSH